jgi:hypothetical protein
MSKIKEGVENTLFTLLGGIIGAAWHHMSDTAGEKLGSAAGDHLTRVLGANPAQLIVFWEDELRREDPVAADRLTEWMALRTGCRPRTYGNNRPYVHGDENRATQALSAIQAIAKGRRGLELFKRLGHSSHEKLDLLIDVTRIDNAAQFVKGFAAFVANAATGERARALDATVAGAINGLTARLRGQQRPPLGIRLARRVGEAFRRVGQTFREFRQALRGEG